MSYFITGAPLDWALTNWKAAEVPVSWPACRLSPVTALGGAGGGEHSSGMQSCWFGSQMLQMLVTGSQTSVEQGATLATTRPVSVPASLLIVRRRASPEPGGAVEMVASRGLTAPVMPVQSP